MRGDFSTCLDFLKNPSGEYNLYSNNCSQVSLGALASADTPYKEMLQSASEYVLPSSANDFISENLSTSSFISGMIFCVTAALYLLGLGG